MIEARFLDYVRARGEGPLFYLKPKRGDGRMHPSKGVCNKIGTWIRSRPGFDNERIDPAHGMRHWWKSAAVRAGVADSVADHLQGHAAASVAGRYRHFEIETLAQAVAQIPIPGQGVVVNRGSAMPVPTTA